MFHAAVLIRFSTLAALGDETMQSLDDRSYGSMQVWSGGDEVRPYDSSCHKSAEPPREPAKVPKVYLAGPMSGKVEFNVPAFRRGAERLRAAGYEVVSPVELDERDGIDATNLTPDDVAPGSWEWCRCLLRDFLVVIQEVDGVVVLPGYTKSRGAYMETGIAKALGKPVMPLKKALGLAS